MPTYEVYLPVAVTVEVSVEVSDDGQIEATRAEVDWEGAPWLFSDEQANIWNPSTDDWTSHEGDENNPLWNAERAAESYIAGHAKAADRLVVAEALLAEARPLIVAYSWTRDSALLGDDQQRCESLIASMRAFDSTAPSAERGVHVPKDAECAECGRNDVVGKVGSLFYCTRHEAKVTTQANVADEPWHDLNTPCVICGQRECHCGSAPRA
jgi:hypothetical protein